LTPNQVVRSTRALMESLDEPERHLEFDSELSPYVDGTLDAAGREIVETHIEDCGMCRGELHDLRRLARRRWLPFAWPVFAIAASVAFIALLLLVPRDSPRSAVATPAIAQTTPTIPAPVLRPGAVEVPTQPQPSRPVARGYANADWAKLVATALREGRLPRGPHMDAPLQDTLRGRETGFTVKLSPAGIVVETTRPRFSWTPVRGARYTVSLFRDDEEVAVSKPLRVARWALDRDLARGATYVWQVEVTREDGTSTIVPEPPAPPATFRVLGKRAHAELEKARKEHSGDALLLAVLSAKHGLKTEAHQQLSKLAASDDPRVQRLARAEL
ncbi:MAG: zf-HC2 domain-containing protein, partial [Thermoanaerobaculia bacterium]